MEPVVLPVRRTKEDARSFYDLLEEQRKMPDPSMTASAGFMITSVEYLNENSLSWLWRYYLFKRERPFLRLVSALGIVWSE